jgi:cephalosporin-C deacetylase
VSAVPARAVVEVPRPADFDEFWATTMRRAERTPLDPELTGLPSRSTDRVAAYDVRYGSLDGVRVAGWYTRPRGAGPHPGLLLIPGYISEPTLATTWSELGYAVLSVAPRGKLRAHGAVNPGYPGLLTHDLADPETYAYRGFYADVVRGFDLLRGLSDVDAGRVGVHGSSQGGGLGIVTAALRAGQVACLCAGAPYLCGIMTAPRLTRSYPYHEITEYLTAHPELAEAAAATAAYYDGVNFAPRVTAPTMVYLGLSDDVCPPETGFAVYDALGAADRRLHTYPGCGHLAGLPGVMLEIEAFLARHLSPEVAR